MVFPKYFVLEQLLKSHRPQKELDEFYLIAVQHLLRSTGSLFETIIRYGIKPQKIFVTGKIYSTNFETSVKLKKLGINVIESTVPDKLGYYISFLEKDIRFMWKELMKVLTPGANIIILDDGGYVLKNVPNEVLSKYKVFGIEQTTSGVRLQKSFKNFPVIHVATSAAKRIIEPPIVSEAVRIHLGKKIKELKPKAIGIIGYGHVGKAIANEFKNQYRIFIYDSDKDQTKGKQGSMQFCKTKDELFYQSEIIIGATGHDVSDLKWLEESNGNKILISISSGDIEFNKILRRCQEQLIDELYSPLQNLRIMTKDGFIIQILRGGLVANFTGEPDSSPGPLIQMTRGLLFIGIIQIVDYQNRLKKKTGPSMLRLDLQKEVINYWFQNRPDRLKKYSKECLSVFIE